MPRPSRPNVRPSGPGPRLRAMRLRTLTEAECYTRCYGKQEERRQRPPRPATPRFRRRAPREDAARAGRGAARRARGRGGVKHACRTLDVAPALAHARRAGRPVPLPSSWVCTATWTARATLQAAWPPPLSDVPDVLAPGLRCVFCGINPGACLGRRGRALREPAQRLLAAAPRRRLHAAALRPAGAVRAARARLSASRTPPTARRRARATCGAATSTRPARGDRARARPRAIAFVGKEAYRGALRRAARARPADPHARHDRALRPAVDLARERRRPVRRAAALVPRAARVARAGRAAGCARARRSTRTTASCSCASRPVGGDVWWATPGGGVERARPTSRRCAASCSRRPASRSSSSARSCRHAAHVFAWPGGCSTQHERYLPRARAGATSRADDRPRGRRRRRAALVDARRARARRRLRATFAAAPSSRRPRGRASASLLTARGLRHRPPAARRSGSAARSRSSSPACRRSACSRASRAARR